MLSLIYELDQNGNINKKAEYTCNTKQALINYIMQFKKKNFNTWNYPEHIDGIRESSKKDNSYYYDFGDIVIASYEVIKNHK